MTSNTVRHSLIGQLAALALLAIVFSAMALAQPTASQTPAPKVNLIIERQAVRFDLQGAARSWQLEVFNQPGDLIFASGVVSQATLEWALADQQEKPLADGLYVYTLKFWNENNEQVSVQRGHVIVNRAGSGDRIWVTSNNSTGVGSASELTVVGSADSTVGGARLAESSAPVPARAVSERTQTKSVRESGASADPLQAKDNGVINAVGPINGDGTAGRIAKFTGAHTIDDSVMSESGGKIRVNFTGTPTGRLHVAEGFGIASIYGRNNSGQIAPNAPGFTGVHGDSIGTGSIGVQGTSSGNSSIGLYGNASGGSFTTGVRGIGVTGVNGSSTAGTGVLGESESGLGVSGTSDTNAGVRGDSNSSSGVYGNSFSGRGVYGNSTNHHGVAGRSQSQDHAGVHGYSTSANGVGVLGEALGGTNQTSIGVYGRGSGWGVVGVGEAGHGVAGYGSFLGASIYGASGAGWAGFFDGNVEITGTLNANNFTGNFASKIDHPLDPANKYLSQSVIESPEMMSVQNGNITTDGNGEAIITLPDYFQAMNGGFRYQLTVVGQFAQAIVAQKIDGNRFTIRTDKPNVEVSWQVTGVRQDAAAKANRKPVEELKPEAERGHYLRPELFGQSEEKSVEWARHPEMMKRMKAEREQRQRESGRKPQQ